MKTLVIFTAFAATAIAAADGFESPPYNGTSAGVILSGQQGWINPTPGLPDFKVYDYPSNALGFSANTLGQGQFIAGICGANQAYARTEKPVAFSANDVWTVSYLMAAKFNGVVPATNNISKFSLQPAETTKSFNATAQWPNGSTPTQWHYGYEVADLAGTMTGSNVYPNTAWRFLNSNQWYRFSTTFDLDTRELLYTTITNLATGVTTAQQPDAWYLTLGSDPAAVRFFVGGTTFGNALAVDHFNVTPGAVVPPDAVTLIRGVSVSSGVIRLLESDDVRLQYRPGIVFSTSAEPIQLVVRSRAHETGPPSISVRIESSASAGNTNQTIALWNFQTATYEQVDSRLITTTDALTQVNIPTNAARFVEPSGTREVRIRLGYKVTGPVFAYPWTVRVDHVAIAF